MALGDSYSNNKQTNLYDPEVFSQYSLSNKDGLVDPSMLSIRFWNGLLKLSIYPKLPNATQEHIWNKEDAISIYLNHTKARILAEGIDSVLDPNTTIHNYGVSTRDGLVSFSDGKEIGIESPCLILRKIDQNDGHVISSYIYEFRIDYHSAVINFDPKNISFDKVYLDSLEVEQFKDLLKSYYIAMTNAESYAVVSSYQFKRLSSKVDQIGEAVGIASGEKPNYSKKGGTSFFNNPNSGNGGGSKNAMSRSATIDDIDNEMMGD